MAYIFTKLKNTSSVIIIVLIVTVVLLGIALYSKNQELTITKNALTTTSDVPTQKCPAAPTATIITTAATCGSEFIITATNYKFIPNQITVNKGDHVKIIFKVLEGYHDLTISAFGVQTPRFGASTGKDATLEFIANKTGRFPFIDSVADHSDELGQTGTIIVK